MYLNSFVLYNKLEKQPQFLSDTMNCRNVAVVRREIISNVFKLMCLQTQYQITIFCIVLRSSAFGGTLEFPFNI